MQNRVVKFNIDKQQFQFSDEKISPQLMKPDEVLVKQELFNLDEYTYKTKKASGIFGEVLEVGSQVSWLQKGDKVISISKFDSFAAYQILHHQTLFKSPNFTSKHLVLPLIVRGFIAHMLTVRVIIVREGMHVIVDNIDTPTGTIIGWLAKQRGAKVLGINHSQKEISHESADWIISKSNPQILQQINELMGGVAHIYFTGSLATIDTKIITEALAPMGVIVDSFSSIENFSVDLLTKKALFFTRPQLEIYKSKRTEIILTLKDLETRLKESQPQIEVESFKLDDIQIAFEKAGQNEKCIVIES
jgi:NADPH:quinone reductase-like Zn-dependent oxidoreductase